VTLFFVLPKYTNQSQQMKAITTRKPNIFGIFICLILGTGHVFPQYSSPIDMPIAACRFSIIGQNENGIDISFSLDVEYVDQLVAKFRQAHSSSMWGQQLPIFSTYLAIPKASDIAIDHLASEVKMYLWSQTHLKTANSNPYNSDSCRRDMESILSFSDPMTIRGISVVHLKIFPFTLKDQHSELVVHHQIDFSVRITGNTQFTAINRYRNVWWDKLLSNMLLNYSSLPQLENSILDLHKNPEDGAEYLIISPNGQEFVQWADSLKLFRTQQGILTKVITLDEIGGNTALQIEDYIDEAYTTWSIPPAGILLLGDYGNNPENSIIAPAWENYCVSDNIYADVNGDDLPEIYVGRICAQNVDDLVNTVGKLIHYETEPPIDTAFYNYPITSCAFQIGGIRQVVTESIAGFYEVTLAKNTNRIYTASMPLPDEWTTIPEGLALVEYFGPDGLGYIPASPAGVVSNWDGTTQDIIDGVNSGSFMTLFIGQGSETGWSQPTFNVGDISELSGDTPTFIWSVTSLTGKFNYGSDCFAEAIHKVAGGALGIVAASEVTYAFTGELMVMGAYDQMWPQYLPDGGNPILPEGIYPAMGMVAGKYFLQQYNWPINPNTKATAYHAYHYFGDVFSAVYTEVPQTANVMHPEKIMVGSESIPVTAMSGSLIGLTVEDMLIAKTIGTGTEIIIPIPPLNPGEVIQLTVTKQNYLRFSVNMPVVDSTTGIAIQPFKNGKLPFAVHPNPIRKNFIQIEFSDRLIHSRLSIDIFDTKNSLVYSRSNLYIEDGKKEFITSQLKKGLYFLIVHSGRDTWVQKIVIL
jgi:hypothetical protein